MRTGCSRRSVSQQSRAISLTVFFVTALMSILALYSIYMRARRYYPELQREADLRRTKDGESSPAEYDHPTNLVEATMDGEPGPRYYGGGSGGDLPYGGVYENSTTRLPMYHRTNTSVNKLGPTGGGQGSQGPFADPAASTYTIPFDTPIASGGGGASADWSQVEERERREAELANAYDTNQGSYSHLPLASASEVETQSHYRAGAIPYLPPSQPPPPHDEYSSNSTNPTRNGYGSIDLSR